MRTGLCCFYGNGDRPDITDIHRDAFPWIDAATHVAYIYPQLNSHDWTRKEISMSSSDFCNSLQRNRTSLTWLLFSILIMRYLSRRGGYCQLILCANASVCMIYKSAKYLLFFLFFFRRSADNHDLRDGHRYTGKFFYNTVTFFNMLYFITYLYVIYTYIFIFSHIAHVQE